MTRCFNIDSNTMPDTFKEPGFSEYVPFEHSARSIDERMLLLSPTATIAQLHRAIFSLKPMPCRLTEAHTLDLMRNHRYSVFGHERPSLAHIESVLLHHGSPVSLALMNLLKANLFSQSTFLFSLKQSIDTRILQLEGQSSLKYPVGSSDAEPSITIDMAGPRAFSVCYQNKLCYQEYRSEEGKQGSQLKISGQFVQEIRFELLSPQVKIDQRRYINKYGNRLSCLLPTISSMFYPYPLLQATVLCAEYYVDEQYAPELQRLGFDEQQFFTPLSSTTSSPKRVISPGAAKVRRTLAAAAHKLSQAGSDTNSEKLPSDLPASNSSSIAPSRTGSRERPVRG